jgi:hypothetical protein
MAQLFADLGVRGVLDQVRGPLVLGQADRVGASALGEDRGVPA